MFTLTEEFPVHHNILHEYRQFFSNGDFELCLSYKVNGDKKVAPEDPTKRKQVFPVVIPMRKELPDIIFNIRKIGSDSCEYVIVAEFLGDGLFFCQCDGTEKPTWRLACKAIMEMDKLIRELFPG